MEKRNRKISCGDIPRPISNLVEIKVNPHIPTMATATKWKAAKPRVVCRKAVICAQRYA